MAIQLADVIIHIDETLDQTHLERLRDRVLEQAGVMTADYRLQQRHLMVVGYDPDRNSAGNLLKAVTAQGLHAELIGL
jgi:hypothetical protein